MGSLFSAFILGIVEGLTEFLPVSSTGHLIIAGHILAVSGLKAASFEIIIQLGAILAVIILYWKRFTGLLKPNPRMAFSGIRGLRLLFLTSIPAAILGLFIHKYIKEYLFNPKAVAITLAIGAVMMIVVEALPKKIRYTELDEINPKIALGIGFFQCLSLFPGFSRSASTIMGGMLLGTGRKLAAEYSFIAAVPIMFAATCYDLLKSYNLFNLDDLSFFAVGFIFAFVSAWIAIKIFISLVSRVSLRPFAYYRLIIAPLIYYFMT